MRVLALSVGRPQIMMRQGRQVSTSIHRRAVPGAIDLTPLGLAGDRVSDERVHGGPDNALCVYPSEHYPYFSRLVGRELAAPAFGENLTTEGLLETEVCIGDRWRIGDALLEVSQPRQPCQKLALKHENPRLIAWVNETGYSGWYLRVLEPAAISAGATIELVERAHEGYSIAALSRAMAAPPNVEFLRTLIELPALAERYRNRARRRMAGMDDFGE